MRSFGRRGKTQLLVASEHPLRIHATKNGRAAGKQAALTLLRKHFPDVDDWSCRYTDHSICFEPNAGEAGQDTAP